MRRLANRSILVLVVALIGFGMTLAHPSETLGDSVFWVGLFCMLSGLVGLVYIFTERQTD
jgi:uncharacterized membrane protein HdeD (DUF308 family)